MPISSERDISYSMVQGREYSTDGYALWQSRILVLPSVQFANHNCILVGIS